VRNAAEAEDTFGLATLDRTALLGKAHRSYNEFVADFKEKGYEIISSETVSQSSAFKGWNKQSSPEVKETDMTGNGATVPGGFSYYCKDRNGFSSKLIGFDKIAQNLSK
jgi:hypothetical protein